MINFFVSIDVVNITYRKTSKISVKRQLNIVKRHGMTFIDSHDVIKNETLITRFSGKLPKLKVEKIFIYFMLDKINVKSINKIFSFSD